MPEVSKKKYNSKLWVILAIVLIILGWIYWKYSELYPSTDNAYIGANIINISPEVTGPILNLYTENHAYVKKNQPILDIDPAPFQIAVDKAKANLDLAGQNVQGLGAGIESATALVERRKAELELAQKNYQRIIQLVKKGQATLIEGDRVTNVVTVSKASLAEALKQLEKEKAEYGVTGNANAQLRAARAELDKALLDLKHTHIVSPVDGYVINLTARAGTMLTKDTIAFSIIDQNNWWVDAHFKETQMARIRSGQKAKIQVDLYPSYAFHGKIESISRGSGTAFSVFPPENATGNWVKITQRFTVKIPIANINPKFPLRVGASATVTVDTTS